MNARSSLAWVAALMLTLSWVMATAQAANRVDPSGTWTWVRELEGQEGQSVLVLSYKDGKLTGFYKREGQAVPISNAKFENNEISFDADGKWNEQKIRGKFKGKLSRDEINGSIEIVVEDGSLPLAWVARRGIDADDLAGTWKLKLVTSNGETIEPTLKLTAESGSLKGTYTSSRFGQHDAKEIKLNGSQLSWTIEFERDGQTVKEVYRGTIEAGAIKGKLALDAGGNTVSLEFRGERGLPTTESAKTAARKSPKPNVKPADGKSTDRAPAKRRVIVMLKSRQAILVVYAAAGKRQGPTFSIRSTEGKEATKEMSLKDLQVSYPQICEQFRTSFAGSWADSVQRLPRTGNISPSRKVLRSVKLYRGVDAGWD